MQWFVAYCRAGWARFYNKHSDGWNLLPFIYSKFYLQTLVSEGTPFHMKVILHERPELIVEGIQKECEIFEKSNPWSLVSAYPRPERLPRWCISMIIKISFFNSPAYVSQCSDPPLFSPDEVEQGVNFWIFPPARKNRKERSRPGLAIRFMQSSLHPLPFLSAQNTVFVFL